MLLFFLVEVNVSTILQHLRVKIFQIAAQRFRLRPQTYQQVILTVCGLVRLRIGALVLPT